MAYVPLHHKYRPQRFADVVGQSAVVQTLSNAIRGDRIAPAYLFCGPRGTGKTSSARILAKSLNCVEGPTPEPCNQCDACTSITGGSSLDVIEIDAASNTGVDNIRELIERSQFAPVNCRYKVYVLDEVHMLSTAAFNALLKTLEEPPPQVVFVLATTDPQRVLPTVISRCQRFDFRRIPLEAMVHHLQAIAEQEQIAIADTAVELIAQIAQGGLRDAESLLDQLSLLPDKIAVENVWDLVGAVPERELLALLDAIARKDAQQVVSQLRHLMDNGKEPLILLQNLTGFFRDLLLAKTVPGQREMVALTQPTWEGLVERAPNYAVADILAVQRRLIDVEPLLKNTTQPRLWLEISLLNLLQAPAEAIASTVTPVAAAPAISTPVNPAPVTSAPVNPAPVVRSTQPAAASAQPANPAVYPASSAFSSEPKQPKPQSVDAPPPVLTASAAPVAPVSTPVPVALADRVPADTVQPSSSQAPAPKPTAQPLPTSPPVPAGQALAAHWQAMLDSLPFSKSALLKLHVSVREETQKKATLALSPNMRAFASKIRGLLPELETLAAQRIGRDIKLDLVLGESKPTASAPATAPAPAPAPITSPPGNPPPQPVAIQASAPAPASVPPSSDSAAPAPIAQSVPAADLSTAPVAETAVPGRSPVQEPDILDRATHRLADFFSGSIVEELVDETEEVEEIEIVEASPAVALSAAPTSIPSSQRSTLPNTAALSESDALSEHAPVGSTPTSPASGSMEEDLEEDEYELPF
ncbi:MAG: DNA polymerase III subunit gamma/tau [Synechococcus sp.]